MPSRQVHLSFSCPTPEAASVLAAQAGISNIRLDGQGGQFTFNGDVAEQGILLANLITAGLPVSEFSVIKSSLQDLYLADLSGEKS